MGTKGTCHELRERPRPLADSWGKLPTCGAGESDPSNRQSSKPAQFRRFLKLAQAVQSSPHRRMGRRMRQWGNIMTAFSNYAQNAFAAIGALAISVVLFANTLATQAAEVQSVAGILA